MRAAFDLSLDLVQLTAFRLHSQYILACQVHAPLLPRVHRKASAEGTCSRCASSSLPFLTSSCTSLTHSSDLIQEPASYRPATPPPTIRSYTRRADFFGEEQLDQVDVGLVSGHPLWGAFTSHFPCKPTS